jgi:1-phosphofructokinase family hexose kinase
MAAPFDSAVTVTLNTAIDCVIEVPGFTVGAHQVGRRMLRTPAGKGINVARTLAALGHSCVAAGFVGRDDLDYFETELDEHRVQPQLLAIDGQTRENVTLIDPENATETHVRDAGFAVTADDVQRLERKLALLAHDGVLVAFCGSLPRNIAAGEFARLVDICLERQALVAVDTEGPVLQAVRDRPLWAVKPNREELAAFMGEVTASDDDLIRVGRALGQTVARVIVSCGAAGGYLFADGGVSRGQVEVDPKKVVSTVGCGDTLLAAFVAAQMEGHDAVEAYRRALAAATAASTHPVPGEVDPAAVRRFLAVTAVETLP